MAGFFHYLSLFAVLTLCPVLLAEVRINENGENPSVEWIQEGETVFDFTFERPQHIYAAEPSLSGDYFMIWHMDFSPRKLKIFRVKDGEMITDLVPGFGGSLIWTKGDVLLHSWGCGTNCQVIQVISSRGDILRTETVSGHFLTSEGFYLVFSSLDADPNQDLIKVDATTGERTPLLTSIPHAPHNFWIEEDRLKIDFGDKDHREIDLSAF